MVTIFKEEKNSNGKKEDKVLTGYPHIDRMWLENYDPIFLQKPMPKMTIYDYMRKHTNDSVDLTALTYYGSEISYGEFYEKIEDTSKFLHEVGVSEGSRVLYLMPNIPETAYFLYGGSRLGAVADYVDPRPDSLNLKLSAKKVFDTIKSEKITHIVSVERCYLQLIKPIEDELKEYGIQDIVIVPVSNSMNMGAKIEFVKETLSFEGLRSCIKQVKWQKDEALEFEEARKNSPLNIILYNEYINNCKETMITPAPYRENRLSIIPHTSGTSGAIPKGIPLTDDNLNAYVHQTFGANMLMEPGDKALHVLPYFAAYGVVDVTHAGLCHANNLIQVPLFQPKNLGKLVKNHKIQILIGTPSWFVNMIKQKELQNSDLSFLKMITYGGDSMSEKDEAIVNEFLKTHNCPYPVTKGHGMSETAGCASYATLGYNKPGTMGIPMPNTTYAIVDPETKKPIKFGDLDQTIEGELAIAGESITSGKLDDKVITKKIELDGETYILTGDLAEMDRNGILRFQSRMDRTFTRFDGFKIATYKIESIIMQHPSVLNCIITPYFDDKNQGKMPMATIVLDKEMLTDDEEVELVKDIIDTCFTNNQHTTTRQIPTKFRILSELPLSKNGKIDYNSIKIEGLSGNEINVDLDETNVSITGIKVYKSKGKTLTKKFSR